MLSAESNDSIITLCVYFNLRIGKRNTPGDILEYKTVLNNFLVKNCNEFLCLGYFVKTGLDSVVVIMIDLLNHLRMIYHPFCS